MGQPQELSSLTIFNVIFNLPVDILWNMHSLLNVGKTWILVENAHWSGNIFIWGKCSSLTAQKLAKSYTTNPSHEFHDASDKYPTIYHFVIEMCKLVQISVTKLGTVGYGTGTLWNLCNSINLFHWRPDRHNDTMLANSKHMYVYIFTFTTVGCSCCANCLII